MRTHLLAATLAVMVTLGCGAAPASPPSAPIPRGEVSARAQAIIDAPDRSTADRTLDGSRHAAELLTFFAVEPGMRVAEIVAGTGYTAELLARAVAPKGVVYAQNPRFFLASGDKPWSARLATPAAKTIVRVDRELDDPLPPEAKDLDLVVGCLVYHEAILLGADRDKLNRAIFAALRPGGRYAIIDHSARDGAGLSDAQSLHRIEEKVVREEVTRAGFALLAEASFLRNSSDTRDWNVSSPSAAAGRPPSDRFALMFVKR